VSRSPTASSVADDSRWPLLCRPAQMAPAHHGVEHLVCGRTTETWFPLLIALSTLFVDARRSSKTPRPEKVTKVARNCTEKYSVDWRPKSAFEMMYIFYQARPNHAPKILGVQGVTRAKHVKLHAPGVQFSTPRACCTALLPGTAGLVARISRPCQFTAAGPIAVRSWISICQSHPQNRSFACVDRSPLAHCNLGRWQGAR